MSEPFKLSDDQKELLRQTMLGKLPSTDCNLFFQAVERTQLDPFKRQIYAQARWNKELQRNVLSTQTSIDGFRLIAQRSGQYAGQAGPFWCGADGKWLKDGDGHPMAWLSTDYPSAALVGVLRERFQAPLFAVARWESYVQKTKDGGVATFWHKMPDLMLGKVAEALALRRAFPDELSGLYTSEEMDQAENHAMPAEAVRNAYPPAKPKVLSVSSAAEPEKYKMLTGILSSLGCRRGHQEECNAVLSLCYQDWTLTHIHDTAGACDSALERLAQLQEEFGDGDKVFHEALKKAGLRPESVAVEAEAAEVF